ncbi:hypothetical protein [Streptomyces sp. NPDC005408]|uniref:hypothetical protein n=1 Tax=Streptomyces sp. NPDC005408 TaxID=3155341 RepID=UPI0033A4B4C6
MRRTALALATALLITAGTAGCSSGSKGSGSARGATGSPSPSAPTPVAVGTTITKDLKNGGKVAYTVKRVVDPATPAPTSKHKPAPGTHWVGVELSFANVGSTYVEESPWRTQLMPPLGSEPLNIKASVDYEIVEGASAPYFMRLQRGQHAAGFFVFELPGRTKYVGVQYMPLGPEDPKMQWKVN